MKKSNLQIAAKSAFRFNRSSFFTLLFIAFLTTSYGQVSKVFSEEITVEQGTTINSNLPSTLNLSVIGTLTTNNTKDRYTLSGKHDNVRLNIAKELTIETLDKNIVRQETTINVKTASEQESNALLEQLKIKLKKGPNNSIEIDCNLNIKLFTMKNGFLKVDDCKVELDNGKVYTVEYLEIETKLSIPKSSNLSVKGDSHGTLRLGDLDGDLNLELKYTEVFGGKVRILSGELLWCYNVIFEEVASAVISATNSYLSINQLGGITIGNTPLNKSGVFGARTNSSQTKYHFGTVGLLSVNDSANDEINVKEVGMLEVKNTAFTDFQINRLNSTLAFKAKNSDLTIDKVGKEFLELDINNSLSEISIGMEKDANYLLHLDRSNYMECTLDNGPTGRLKQVSKGENSKEVYQAGEKEKGGVISVICKQCKFDIH